MLLTKTLKTYAGDITKQDEVWIEGQMQSLKQHGCSQVLRTSFELNRRIECTAKSTRQRNRAYELHHHRAGVCTVLYIGVRSGAGSRQESLVLQFSH